MPAESTTFGSNVSGSSAESFPAWPRGRDHGWHPVLGSGTSASEPPIPQDSTEGGPSAPQVRNQISNAP